MDGIININKPKGFTSFDVVAKMRGILKTKKIGHTGTLDPDATGVLPVCVGKATKLCDMFTQHDKVYECTILLGTTTDTEDITGKIQKCISPEQVCSMVDVDSFVNAVNSFVGPYAQIPPMYSAVKVDGKKLYTLAREGKIIERTPRPVEIYDIKIQEPIVFPEVVMTIHCSKGTYIRSLCRDIGDKLLVGACMKKLVRLRTGQFSLDTSITLEDLERYMRETSEDGQPLIEQHILRFSDIFKDSPKAVVKEECEKYLLNGNMLCEDDFLDCSSLAHQCTKDTSRRLCIYNSKHEMKALYYYDLQIEQYKPDKMFL